jgi:hypothetical protein
MAATVFRVNLIILETASDAKPSRARILLEGTSAHAGAGTSCSLVDRIAYA